MLLRVERLYRRVKVRSGRGLILDMTDKMIAWIDVESTGTSPDRDMILEIAGIVTDMQGRQYGDSFSTLVDTGSISEA